jgi:hypothetical protein
VLLGGSDHLPYVSEDDVAVVVDSHRECSNLSAKAYLNTFLSFQLMGLCPDGNVL